MAKATLRRTNLRYSWRFLVITILTMRFGIHLLLKKGAFWTIRNALTVNPAKRASLVIMDSGVVMDNGTSAALMHYGTSSTDNVTSAAMIDNGTSTTMMDGGTSTTLMDDGTSTTTMSDNGESTTMMDNGTSTNTMNSETSIAMMHNGKNTTMMDSETIATTIDNGTTSTLMDNGTRSTVMDNATSTTMVDIGSTMTDVAKGGFHICHATKSHQYFCEGPLYDLFADKLEAFLYNQTNKVLYQNRKVVPGMTKASKSRCWGKRPFPFPANTTILAVGNSHTRQILYGLRCQYATIQVIEPELKETQSTANHRGTYYIIEFANHAKLHLVTNHALFYSRKWQKHLEAMLKRKVKSFDALIVGKINTFTLAHNTSFMALMMEKSKEYEGGDFASVPPPTLYDFARVFPGPIVAHSMMADYGNDVLNKAMIGLVKRVKRANVHFVNGRAYIPLLGECASDHCNEVSDCSTKAKGHRCIGKRGGHPDLLAWDIIEVLNKDKSSCSLYQLGQSA